MREALEFYADPMRYHGPNQRNTHADKWSGESSYIRDVIRDGGDIARAALASQPAQGEATFYWNGDTEDPDFRSIWTDQHRVALYTAPPAPSVPDGRKQLIVSVVSNIGETCEGISEEGAVRTISKELDRLAAMLAAAPEPPK